MPRIPVSSLHYTSYNEKRNLLHYFRSIVKIQIFLNIEVVLLQVEQISSFVDLTSYQTSRDYKGNLSKYDEFCAKLKALAPEERSFR